MSRYYYTTEAAHRLGCGVQEAWRILKREGVEAIGSEPRDDGGGKLLVWRAVDVERVREHRRRMTGRQRAIQGRILAGILKRRAKREARCGGTC